MKIVLLGDSIFDNGTYVDSGESVSDTIQNEYGIEVSLLARDGFLVKDVHNQIIEQYPQDTITFLSCGVNDILHQARIVTARYLSRDTTGDAIMNNIKYLCEEYRERYATLLDMILTKTDKLITCSIYNKIPRIPPNVQVALGFFNEIIFEESIVRKISMIDLRIVCNNPRDYSFISFIEPSYRGGKKIAEVIQYIAKNHAFDQQVKIYS